MTFGPVKHEKHELQNAFAGLLFTGSARDALRGSKQMGQSRVFTPMLTLSLLALLSPSGGSSTVLLLELPPYMAQQDTSSPVAQDKLIQVMELEVILLVL